MNPKKLTTIALCSATLWVAIAPAVVEAATDSANPVATTRMPAVSTVSDLNQAVPTISTQLVGASDVVANHIYSLNVHGRKVNNDETAYTLNYEIEFDADKFEFISADQTKGDTKVTLKAGTNNVLQVTSTSVEAGEVSAYGKTRLARVQLKAKAVTADTAATVTIKAAQATVNDAQAAPLEAAIVGQQKVLIHAKDTADLNQDGLVGIGDVAKASDMAAKMAAAQNSEIRPYKHVIVLTTDGGGNPWDPEGLYYAASKEELP
ncbi:cohesin domain-containing protein [Agrilactobacillus yilanensis]|uniref:Cohesin domain-containing protein n=1 Tax=Agrilactobacillus yilanensis TaxID=2485997 RepID=A0ABW4J9D4_9LACO|nr:cohesin domain-containing protein [Agrilactobacillus yilanensis]